MTLEGPMAGKGVTTVAVCVPTFKRPVELDVLLKRLATLDLGDRITMSVFVVDNDLERSADEVIERHRALGAFELVNSHEPVPGYVAVRNHLKRLVPPEIDWIASIDDDDVPAADDWLLCLLDVAENHDAEMVCGPKTPAPGLGIGSTMLERGAVHHKNGVSGSPMPYGWTGNLLIRRSILPEDPFDERFALTGAEDTELTMRLVDRGHRLVYAPDAMVVAWKTTDQLTVERTASILRNGSSGLAMAYLVNHGGLPPQRVLRSAIRYVESTMDRHLSALLGQSKRSDRALLRQAGAAGILTTGVLRRPMAPRIALAEPAPLSDSVGWAPSERC